MIKYLCVGGPKDGAWIENPGESPIMEYAAPAYNEYHSFSYQYETHSYYMTLVGNTWILLHQSFERGAALSALIAGYSTGKRVR